MRRRQHGRRGRTEILYAIFFQADFCFGKYTGSVSGARLTALGARLHTSCL